ncbi:MAG TPA: carboxypeptidase-like regulatory domain-containing protein [Terriglobales bacterium]|nr:carboxypeptidase-like regulatory domain-containing protein [Terriglobales bacterium]
MTRATAYFLILLFASARSADSNLAIKGVVTDSEGAVIAKARVFIHWDGSSKMIVSGDAVPDISVLTDDKGAYTTAVPPGFYDLFVTSPAFTPVASKVIVKPGQPATFNAKLYVDPLVSKEIGGMQVESGKP